MIVYYEHLYTSPRTYNFILDGNTVYCEKEVKLNSVTIDYQHKFDTHIRLLNISTHPI